MSQAAPPLIDETDAIRGFRGGWAEFSFRPHVREQELQERFGLGTHAVWDADCFSFSNNRLILLAGEVVGALVTQHDFAEESRAFEERSPAAPTGGLETVVAIEILPQFQKRGLACAALRALARNGAVRVIDPCVGLLARLSSMADCCEEEVGEYAIHFR